MKRIRLKDIADELNVSITTISKALNNHHDISEGRRKQIMQLVEKRNYVPNYMAKSLRSSVTKFISIIVSDNSNPYYARVIKGVESVLSTQGYQTIIFNNNENPEKELAFIRELVSINVAGVLITPALGNSKSVNLLKKNHIPHVLVHRYLNKDSDSYVIADDVMAAYIATKYLMEHSHKKVVFLNANLNISAANDRLKGYQKALEEAGVAYDDSLIFSNIIHQEDGYKIMDEVLARVEGKFSLLCFSDYIATGAMFRIQERGLIIKEDVSIMGIDGIEMFSYFYPSLSTVHLPKYELGVISAKLLIEMIKNPNKEKNQRIICKPTLLIRGTA